MIYIWGDRAAGLSAAAVAIESFSQLQDGWNYGSGIAPSVESCKAARRILDRMQMLGIPAGHASAGPDGEILLAASSGQDYVSVTVEQDQTFTFNHEEAGQEVEYAEGIALDDLIRRLTSAAEAIWNISGLLTQGLSIANDVNSMTWLSRSQSPAACQFLRLDAPKQLVA